MLDKIILSKDLKTATVICDAKVFTLYHSECVVDMVTEMFVEPLLLEKRCEEDTAVIEIQMSFPLDEAA